MYYYEGYRQGIPDPRLRVRNARRDGSLLSRDDVACEERLQKQHITGDVPSTLENDYALALHDDYAIASSYAESMFLDVRPSGS